MLKRIFIATLFAAFIFTATAIVYPQTQPLSPTETVRLFYKTMRDRKFREAFAMSIYKPAVDPLSAKEFDDLRPDFEKMAAAIPDQVELSGETVSGDMATVFVKVKETAETAEKSEPITLIQNSGIWIIGDRENEAIVKKAGKSFFFNARIDTHHNDVQDLLTRITLAEVVYSQQHNGQFFSLGTSENMNVIPWAVPIACCHSGSRCRWAFFARKIHRSRLRLRQICRARQSTSFQMEIESHETSPRRAPSSSPTAKGSQ